MRSPSPIFFRSSCPCGNLTPQEVGVLISAGFLRPAFRRAVLRLGRGALRAHAGAHCVHRDVRGFEFRLRLFVGLPIAADPAHAPGLRARRRSAGGRHLYRRTGQGEGTRPFRASVRAGVPLRDSGRVRARPVAGAEFRLAIHVHRRRRFPPCWCCFCSGSCPNPRAGWPRAGAMRKPKPRCAWSRPGRNERSGANCRRPIWPSRRR